MRCDDYPPVSWEATAEEGIMKTLGYGLWSVVVCNKSGSVSGEGLILLEKMVF